MTENDTPLPSVFTRQELYDLVWSEPVQSLAKRLSISDRGLAKVCVAANIPVPARGYWAKLQAGRRATRFPLPDRAFGQSDTVPVRRNRWGYGYERESDAEILNAPIPPAPVFSPDMATVEEKAAAMVRRAPMPLRDSHGWHSQIAKLLDADQARAEKQRASSYSWDAPIFRTRFETRRLHILNALFTCLTRCGMQPHVSGKEGRSLSVTVGTTHVSFTLESTSAAKHLEREKAGYGFTARGEKDKMRLSIERWWSSDAPRPSWEDQPGDLLERHLREITVALVVFGEQSLRDHAMTAHAWRVRRKADLQEAERKRIAEEERKRLELLASQEKARVDHLLAQALALHQAEQIRAYVRAVETLDKGSPQPMSPREFEQWSSWALAQANRIDPVLSGAYRARPT